MASSPNCALLPEMAFCVIIINYNAIVKRQMIYVEEDFAFIEQLNMELRSIGDFTRKDVFNAFEKYITDKAKLQRVIDFGLLHFDYTKYKVSIEGTLFEDGLSEILCLYNSALKQNRSRSIQLFKDSYPAIARGFASQTQILRINGLGTLPDRLDLFVKAAFQLTLQRTGAKGFQMW